MRRLLAPLLLGLSACVFEPQRPHYNSMLVVGEQRNLSLKPEGQNKVWEVSGALWVNKAPVLREVYPRWNRAVARTIPSGNLSASVGVNRQVVARPEARTPELDELASAEEQVLLREVLARRGNRPVVLCEITPPRLRLEPGPLVCRQAGLVVQYGVPQEIVVNPEPPRAEVLGQGSQSNYGGTAPLAYLATTPIGYSRFRNLLPAAPDFAFNDASLAALFIGQKPTGGHSVRLVAARQQGSAWEITVGLTSPAPGSIVTQVITSPYLLVRIPGKPSKVVFRDTSGRVIAEGSALVQ